MKNKNINLNKIVILLFFVVLALISAVKISDWASNPKTHKHSIEVIEKNKSTVLKLTAASTAASATVSLLPGDACTPISEQLAKLSTYFLIVLSALYLEKYLLTLFGYIAFKILIPIGLLCFGWGISANSRKCKEIAFKLILSALFLFVLIPASVKVSDVINATYESSYEQVVDEANEISADQESSNKFEQIVSWMENATSKAVNYVTSLLSHFMDALAVMLVTSCLIPVVVLLVFVAFIKMLLNSDKLNNQVL